MNSDSLAPDELVRFRTATRSRIRKLEGWGFSTASLDGKSDHMRTFLISTVEGELKLQWNAPLSGTPYEHWSYVAEINTPSVSARVESYDHLPQRFVEFFDSLARDWQGWPESRVYESLEHTLKVSARHTGKGHAVFNVLLRAGASEDFNWSVSLGLSVELGQLQQVANAARKFASVGAQVAV